jgi:hypothetical protein
MDISLPLKRGSLERRCIHFKEKVFKMDILLPLDKGPLDTVIPPPKVAAPLEDPSDKCIHFKEKVFKMDISLPLKRGALEYTTGYSTRHCP